MQIKVKITDKYIYIYNKTLTTYESKYIKNGIVDNVEKLIIYLRRILNKSIINKKYIFILDSNLNNSDIFVYKYVFNNIGLLNYKIINDIDIIKEELNKDNIIIMSWNSSINYCYLDNENIIVNKYNNKIINNLNKKYIILIGDNILKDKFNKPVYTYENGIGSFGKIFPKLTKN
jgi:hypothetical protein